MYCCPVLNLAKQLISIPSVSPLDLGCQNIIASRLSKMGFNISFLKHQKTNNFWAYKGHGITLSFAGHTDVVSSGNNKLWNSCPFIPVIKNGYLFGRGVSDMKGAIAAMIIAAERFITYRPNYSGRLSFLITSDEESHAQDGTIRIIEYLKIICERINFCIIGEPTSDKVLGDVVKIGRRGSLNVDLFVYGLQGHVAYPQLTGNVIHNVLPFLNALIAYKWSQGNKNFLPTTIQISNIHSGLGNDNVIPGELYICLNFRFGTDISVQDIQNKMISLLSKYRIKYTLKWRLSGHPFLTHSKHLVHVVHQTIRDINHINPMFSTSGGTSDGRFIKDVSEDLIELGLLNNTIHAINECTKVYDLQLLSLMYEDIMKKILF
ncbi:succinyl-diaminopimelate desuccinylase [Buchnera aphidicola]|uniref:Succinyl-diaminopimelate desuccinylase n=1 Tax=Buchnera aphidicola (Stegophylla sp.) TaxID=2315800 RepID=A0A4D6YJZ7_9GAMM|nr:succinyl-diaminopimelate desuccinylase [Buchnera aphidicola (Stegophylla sp.)]